MTKNKKEQVNNTQGPSAPRPAPQSKSIEQIKRELAAQKGIQQSTDTKDNEDKVKIDPNDTPMEKLIEEVYQNYGPAIGIKAGVKNTSAEIHTKVDQEQHDRKTGPKQQPGKPKEPEQQEQAPSTPFSTNPFYKKPQG